MLYLSSRLRSSKYRPAADNLFAALEGGCPICGGETLDLYHICPRCGWEYDGTVEDDAFSGANDMTVREYREQYRQGTA